MGEIQEEANDPWGVSQLFYFRLFLKLVRLNLKSQMEYRTNFIFSIVHILALQFGSLALLWVVINRFQTLGGWTFEEITFLFGLRLLPHGLFVLFFSEITYGLKNYVLNSEFDRFLLRPINPLFMLITNNILLNGITDFVSGVIILTVSSYYVDFRWTILTILVLCIVVFGGLLIEVAIYLIASSVVFWVLKLEAINYIVFQFHEQYILYPIHIYGRPIQLFLTYVVPLAFINYYPAISFFDKSALYSFSPYLVYLTPIVGMLSFVVAYQIWQKGLLAYQSSGS